MWSEGKDSETRAKRIEERAKRIFANTESTERTENSESSASDYQFPELPVLAVLPLVIAQTSLSFYELTPFTGCHILVNGVN